MTVTLHLRLIARTADAILVSPDDPEEAHPQKEWLPLSAVKEIEVIWATRAHRISLPPDWFTATGPAKDHTVVSVTISERLAIEKGLA